MTHTLSGWLFDVYANPDPPSPRHLATLSPFHPSSFILHPSLRHPSLSVWFIDDDGAPHQLCAALQPSFYVGGVASNPRAAELELRRVCEWLVRARLPVQLKRVERYDPTTRRDRVVLEVKVLAPAQYERIVARVTTTFPNLDYYNADLSIPQLYFIEHDLFPLARCQVIVNDVGEILDLAALDSPWDIDYVLPPLRIMTLRLQGEDRDPNHGYRAPLELSYDNRSYVLDADHPRDLVLSLRSHLLRYDPDLVLTDWGDSFILPHLVELARQCGVALPLNRDPNRQPLARPPQSYFSYGRIVYKTAAHLLFGRWHLDRHNAFLADDYGLEGVVEVARLSQRGVQQSARSSTGSANSAMEIAVAYRKNYLIPWRKREPEAWKSGLDLLTSDQGGLTFQPVVGLHHNVAELDFSSMYPSIMDKFNLSYETMHCTCCPDSRVPQIGYAVCRQQRGLIPEMLHPLLQKRFALKRAIRTTTSDTARETYRRHATAIKWILVTCFGYLGYKNARFGRIEAHEAVTAYGRDTLLRAKDLVEQRGYRVLHMLTDSLWVKKPGATAQDYDALVAVIEQATGLPLALEGIYRWIAFLPSRVDARRAVPNRYFGVMRDGEMKIRGIELRRRDTPPWIKQIQRELLDALAQSAPSTHNRHPEQSEGSPSTHNRHPEQSQGSPLPKMRDSAVAVQSVAIITRELDRLRAGQVPLHDLVLTYHLSRDPQSYTMDTLNAIVARELAGRGILLNPGESLRYVITDYHAVAPADRARSWDLIDESWGYDVERYTELLLRAVETVLYPFGVTGAMLRDWLAHELPPAPIRARLAAPTPPIYWGPLFECIGRGGVSPPVPAPLRV